MYDFLLSAVHHTQMPYMPIGLTTAVYSQWTTLGCSPHLLPTAFLQVYKAIVAFLALSWQFCFQLSFLSRMRRRYFASSDILIGVPLITMFGVVCFREKIAISVLSGLKPRPTSVAQFSVMCSAFCIRSLIVSIYLPLIVIATSSA